jgi:hypothetical protein
MDGPIAQKCPMLHKYSSAVNLGWQGSGTVQELVLIDNIISPNFRDIQVFLFSSVLLWETCVILRHQTVMGEYLSQDEFKLSSRWLEATNHTYCIVRLVAQYSLPKISVNVRSCSLIQVYLSLTSRVSVLGYYCSDVQWSSGSHPSMSIQRFCALLRLQL